MNLILKIRASASSAKPIIIVCGTTPSVGPPQGLRGSMGDIDNFIAIGAFECVFNQSSISACAAGLYSCLMIVLYFDFKSVTSGEVSSSCVACCVGVDLNDCRKRFHLDGPVRVENILHLIPVSLVGIRFHLRPGLLLLF